MTITASMVKELRERTGAGMMECKKALVESGGDIDAAIEFLRKSGQAKADKKAGRTAAEGRIVIRSSSDGRRAVMVEINCETDFVASDDNFTSFAEGVADLVLERQPADLESLLAAPMGEGSVEEARKALIAKIGENITVRRFESMEVSGVLGQYLHGSRIGVLVDLEGGDAGLARDVAMHIAASRPVCISADQVDPQLIEKEKEIFRAQAEESGKPPEIVEKMISGRINKYLKEITLLGQPFVKNPDESVEKLLAREGASVRSFARLEVGEGIEKKSENFAEEVMAQVQGS
ncbi:MAG TPA: elongation factor Ts [Gammaproteobacteria bacterium]|nr:elongation factor Ts [Gammaproteobacteria bacterium]